MEKIFADGIRAFGPRQGAPDFVIGQLLITPNDLIAWLRANPDYLQESQYGKQIRFDIQRSKDGTGINCPVNTYRKPEATQADAWRPKEVPTAPPPAAANDDLPF